MSLKKLDFRWIGILITLIFLSGCMDSWGADARYDKTRYGQMQRTIDGSTNKLLGISLQDASRLLSLENVKWDEGYTSVPFGQLRIYHFKGFDLMLSLRAFPRGITPDSHQSFNVRSDSELRSNGVWWVANFYPSLHIDGIDDPKERMSNYWEQVHAGFEERTEEMTAARAVQQQWADFAWSTNMNDLMLLQKNLQAQGIRCMDAHTNSTGVFVPLLVDPIDFTRAKMVATNFIRRNSLSIQIGTDHGWGHEVWENGKKTGEMYF
jgi:hypothetical protein